MSTEEIINKLKELYPKTCKFIDGRYTGGFDNHECSKGIAIDKAIEKLECLNEIATLYIKHRAFGEYPTSKEEYADETLKILEKYKISIEEVAE